MDDHGVEQFQKLLLTQKVELEQRLGRIKDHYRKPLDRDSGERATELENQEVVDALDSEVSLQLEQTKAALARLKANEYGICDECGNPIREDRLLVYPHAEKCMDCAV